MASRSSVKQFPLVSVILTTRDRPRFLSLALACYQHQTYPKRELVVVDDGDAFPASAEAVAAVGGHLMRVEPGTPLGTKLNHGVSAARGTLCQKMDDDDWYAPRFLETMVSTLLDNQAVVCQPVVACLMGFLLFDLARWEIRESIERNIPGATLLFDRAGWEERPFRALPSNEDVWFLLDQVRSGRKLLPVRAIETFLAVRHQGSQQERNHAWTNWGRQSLEDYLRDRPLYERRPETLLPDWALKAYRELHQELISDQGVQSRRDDALVERQPSGGPRPHPVYDEAQPSVDSVPRRVAGRGTTATRSGIWVPLDHGRVISPPRENIEPFPAIKELIDRQIVDIKVFVDRLRPHFAHLDDLPDEPVDDYIPYWNNRYFSHDDARIAYSMVREFKPSKIIEIGSGNSTKFLRKAISDGGLATRLISIDPFPRVEIHHLCDQVMRENLVSIKLELFDQLEAGDILFLDGSHLVFHGSDCPHFYLRVLPRIRQGVFVHLHDICLPDEYKQEFDGRYYGEQYLLGAFLIGNPDWSVRVPVSYLAAQGLLRRDGVSFWMERI